MLLRPILFLHRYVAVAVGALMALWCLSGFVMMYQGYPDHTRAEQLSSLAPLQLGGCCNTGFLPGDDAPLAGTARIEMQLGRAILRQGGRRPVDLATGTPIAPLTESDLLQVAADYAAARGIDGARPRLMGTVGEDQWTIGRTRGQRPVQHIALDDPRGTELYLNGTTGEVFQDTNRRERLLSWLGAIPHWLYPTVLRRNGALWTQVVVWTSVLGTFLTVTGLYVGIATLRRRRRDGRLASPFRGWWYWHHISGLLFGVLALAWVFSGLMTMAPWGLMGSTRGLEVRDQLGGTVTAAELRRFLDAAPSQLASGEFVQLQGSATPDGLQVVAWRADGSAQRLDAAALPAPLAAATVQGWLSRLDAPVAGFAEIDRPDTYYHRFKSEDVELPTYRAILDDAGQTRLYISPTTGAVSAVDSGRRQYRWLVGAMHRLDLAGVRARPAWDAIMLLMLAGATMLCITGTWLALQRIRADLTPRR